MVSQRITRHGGTSRSELCCGSAIPWPRLCTAMATFASLGEMPPQTKTDRGLGLPALFFFLIFVRSFLTNLSPIHSELALNRLLIAVDLG